MSKWAQLGSNTKRWTINSFTYNEGNVKRTSLCFLCSYVKICTHLGRNAKRWTINSFTYPLVNSSMVVNFSAGILTLWVHFLPPIVRLAAKNRFSRGFVSVLKGGGFKCGQNEFLFKKAALCTFLGAICSKMECILPLNALRFGAKYLAFWCKMECVLVQNARWNGAKCETKSIKIHGKWY